MPLLEPHYRLIVPTLVGHCGGPPLPHPPPRPLDALVEGLEQALEQAGAPRAHVLGNSLGGWLSLELAARGRADSVLALSPGQGWAGDVVPPRVERFFRRSNKVAPHLAAVAEQIGRRPRLRSLALRDVVAHPERVPPATAAEMLRAAARCPMLEAFGEAAARGDFRSPLQPIRVPVVIAWAQHDRVLPYQTCTAHFRSAVPHAEWRILPDAGHVSMLDQPELVIELLREVTERAELASAA